MDASAFERFMSRVIVDPNGCWLWQGTLNSWGYGSFTTNKVSAPAHRASYEHHVGPIAEGLHLDHLCRVRDCVRPDHLEPVTVRENLMRSPIAPAAVNARKTHCPKGHPYDEQNTIVQRKGGRICRTCQRMPRRSRRDRRVA